MSLISTNDRHNSCSWCSGILQGLASDGGLLIPATLPTLSTFRFESLRGMPFADVATAIATEFLSSEVPQEVVAAVCRESFTFPLPLVQLDDDVHILELFHGPTAAFKDFGARFMSRLFRYFLGTPLHPLTVLTATSGDTGSAVAHAFFESTDNPTIRVAVLFPKGRVSELQERQMTTLGHNVIAVEVEGTFDDCQRMVKQALLDPSITATHQLTSANSINIARLIPQILYYVYAVLSLPKHSAPIFAVPSGNLGNLTGGLLAHMIGMPATRFIAACNANDSFPRYLCEGYFSPRSSIETVSTAMDVGNPSNFARITHLFHGDIIAMREKIEAYSCSDTVTLEEIARTYEQSGYLVDPHTAVGLHALRKHQAAHPKKSNAPGIVLATAHPAKFGDVLLKATGHSPSLPSQLVGVLSGPTYKRTIKADLHALREIIQSNFYE